MTTKQNQNIGEVQLYGVEFEVSGYLFSSLEVGCNYTYTEAENNTDESELVNVPAHKVVPYVEYAITDKLSTLADAEYNSKRFSSSDGSRLAEDFITANIKLTYAFGNGFVAETGLKNIFDEYYEIEEGYPEAGRTIFANLRYSF